MGSVKNGVQRTSGRHTTVTPVTPLTFAPSANANVVSIAPNPLAQRPSGSRPPLPAANSGSGPRRRLPRMQMRWTVVALIALVALGGGANPVTQSATAASTYILMPRAELMALPTSGGAWSAVKAAADSSFPSPNLCNQDSKHHLYTLAAALVYARTGVAAYGAKARAAILAALPTQHVGCNNAVLSLGRQLTAYVLAADLVDLGGAEDATFRAWLSAIRSKDIGGHSVWTSLIVTHRSAPNNWGAYAGASRIAADIYLGDTADLAAAARITRGFLGDRSAYAYDSSRLDSDDVSWSCAGDSPSYSPENGGCSRNGINLDGGFSSDISRGGSLRWPPANPGIPYQLEALQGAGLQVELLSRNGYGDAWRWSNNALERAGGIISRSGASGGTGWNATSASRQMPWLLNARYGTSLPTRAAGMGRGIGFTDWLYGDGSAPSAGGGGTGGGGTGGTGGGGTGGTSTAAPVVARPSIGLYPAATIPTATVPVLVRWGLASSSNGLRRFDLQMSIDGKAYVALPLASARATSRWSALTPGHHYVYRVRAVDLSGRVSAWKTVGPRHVGIVNDAAASVGWSGSWGVAGYASYIGGRAHFTRSTTGASTLRFSGTSVSWIGPRGPGRGKARVYLDGVLVAVTDQYATSFAPRRVIFSRNVASGTHTLVIRPAGTVGRPTVAIDALEVLAAG